MNRLAKLIKEAQELNNELTAVLTMLNRFTEPEDEGCPLCKNPKVLAHWQNMLKEYERFMMETEQEIALRKIEEYKKQYWVEPHPNRVPSILDLQDWLQQDGK